MTTVWRAALAVALVFAAVLPAAAGYDETWYEAPFWPGEYPTGFTMTADVTSAIRPAPDPDLPRSVACELRARATYHPWNLTRVEADQLEFRSYTPIVRYRVTTPVSAFAFAEDDSELTLDLKPGQEWDYLAYLAEGMFLMKLDGKTYTVGQDLADASAEVSPADDGGTAAHLWLRLTCANGATGWLMISDVEGQPGFDTPNITGYGSAEDAP